MMTILFYSSAAIAIFSALMAITRKEAMHGVLYLIVVLLALALMFFQLGAPFIAALEIIVYAGAIVILFLFVIMMINPPADSHGLKKAGWFFPVVLAGVLASQFTLLLQYDTQTLSLQAVDVATLGKVFFGKYAYTLHLVALFLLVGLIGAFHLANKEETS